MSRQLSFLSCAVICTAALSVVHGETTRDYVQDGLLACWDGVENAGRHCHASSTAVWRDVVGGKEFSLTGVTVGADRMVFAGSATSYGTLNATDTAATFEKAKNGTVEIVYASSTGTGNQVILQSTTTSGISLGINNATLLIVHSSQLSPKIAFSSGIATNGVALRYGNGLFSSALVNGSAATLDSSSTTYWGGADATKTTIGTRTSKASAHFTGSIYCIRVYGRQLTDAEIQANNAVDVSRFRQRNFPGDGDLIITATPLEVGIPTPDYGEEGGLAAGATRVVSCPAAWTNAAGNVAATCNGWKLYDGAGNELSSGPETSFTYTHPDPAASRRLEWQLSVKYKVAATATTGGFTSPAEQWVTLGETATVAATPDASHVFFKWTNDVPATIAAAAATISFPVTSPMSLFATFGDLCEVSDISTLQSVIEAHGEGDRIVLADNLYRPNYTIYLTNGVTLAGSSAEKCIIKPTGSRRVLYMKGATSCLSDITITGGTLTSSDYGAGIYMADGTVASCIISNNTATVNNIRGCGIYMAGGLVTNSVVTRNRLPSSRDHLGVGIFMMNGVVACSEISYNSHSYQYGSTYGGGINMWGGTVTHCVIKGNSGVAVGGGICIGEYGYKNLTHDVLVDRCLIFANTNKTSSSAGWTTMGGGIGVFAQAGGANGEVAVLRNTTIAGNVAPCAGGLGVTAFPPMGAIENCIIADNKQTVQTSNSGYPNLFYNNAPTDAKKALFKNNLVGNGSTPWGASDVSGDAAFKSLANHDYHLSATSDAVDAGLASAYVTDDLDGYAVTDGHPDIGCYEFDLSREPFSCVIACSAASHFVGATLSLSATPVNPPVGAALRYAWTVTDGGENVLTTSGTESSVTILAAGTYTVELAVFDDNSGDLLLSSAADSPYSFYVETVYAQPADDLPAIIGALVDGQTLVLQAGRYSIGRAAKLSGGARIIGAGRDSTILEFTAQNASISATHIRAVIEGVTICNGRSTGSTTPVSLEYATLRDSRITGCSIFGAKSTAVAPVRLQNGALLDRCIIDHNTNSTSVGDNAWVYGRASAVEVAGSGTLRNCLVHHNYSDNSCPTVKVGSNHYGSGNVKNCTIVDNINAGSTLEAVALMIGNAGNVHNTVVARNTSPNWTSTHTDTVDNQTPAASPPNWAVRSSEASWTSLASYNCWGESAETYGTHCTDGAKISFINPAGGNWRIGVNSSCRDAGQNETWMTTAIDLGGNPRIFHDTVDLGCYENQSNPGTVFMLR